MILADTALLDANVLHPMVLCDLLIRLALAGYYRPRWSEDKMLVQTPDEFLLDRWWLDPHGVAKLILEQSAATTRPDLSPTEFLARLRDLPPQFVQLAERLTRA